MEWELMGEDVIGKEVSSSHPPLTLMTTLILFIRYVYDYSDVPD